MLVSEITRSLPASLEWMVLFNLSALRLLLDDNTARQMFFLPESIQLELFSHVILTSEGPVLAPHKESGLVNPQDDSIWPTPETSLYERFITQLDQFPLDEADCLGVGEIAPFFPPVLLYLQIRSGVGEAQAIFSEKPLQYHYELLRAVGVKFIGGEKRGSHYVANFTVDLSTHLHAGELADFTRTGHCNAFFLQHGGISPKLEAGLISAVNDRVTWARDLSLKTAIELGEKAFKQTMAMTCQPPPPAQPFPFGDLVPLGFLLRALNAAPKNSSASKIRKKLKKLVLGKRQDNLWPFHSGDITTSTDSALVLQGITAPESVQTLEEFADGRGGYYPQLWSREEQTGKMVVGDWNRHWCQSDFATTCLVKSLRREAGLATKTPSEYLEKSFTKRSGLYLANPYLVDWALAWAIRGDESASELRSRLLREILVSMNDDYSFGTFDIPLSTAFAILSLAKLGFRDRPLRLAQLRLSEFMEEDGKWPEAIPFYSTYRLPDAFSALIGDDRADQTSATGQIVRVNSQCHAISYYIDSHGIITAAVAMLALSEDCDSTKQDKNRKDKGKMESHPRYRCCNHSEYISYFALPPYL
ncbi:MAG: hypothetical protein ISS57_01070 [Anaerolineales bacterium]|nr:hypothetical protein [Anaerolineales bacterium]